MKTVRLTKQMAKKLGRKPLAGNNAPYSKPRGVVYSNRGTAILNQKDK